MSRYDSCLDDLANGKQSAIYDAIDRSTASIKAIADLISVSVDGGEAADASIPDAAFTIFKIASDLKDATDEYRAQEDKRYNLPLPSASLFMGFEGALKKCFNLVNEASVLSAELSGALDTTVGAEGLRSNGLALSTMIGAVGDHLSSALGQVARVGLSENGPEARRLAKLASVLEGIQADIVTAKDEQNAEPVAGDAADEPKSDPAQVAEEQEDEAGTVEAGAVPDLADRVYECNELSTVLENAAKGMAESIVSQELDGGILYGQARTIQEAARNLDEKLDSLLVNVRAVDDARANAGRVAQ